MALSDKQELFVEKYLVCFNATRAAKEAGYSEKTAYSQGHRLLKDAEVATRIRTRLREAAMDADEVLAHLSAIARADMDAVTNRFGAVDMLSARENNASMLVKRTKQRTITSEDSEIHETELELHDRLKALELLAKYHDLINKVRIDDWRSQAIRDIQAGAIGFGALVEAFDHDLAKELFVSAGVPISEG